MARAIPISSPQVHHKVPGWTRGENGKESPYLLQVGRIYAPSEGYRETYNDSAMKHESEPLPPLNKPEFLRWPKDQENPSPLCAKLLERGAYPSNPPGDVVLFRTFEDAQAWADDGTALQMRADYYASVERELARAEQRAKVETVKLDAGSISSIVAGAIAATQAVQPAEERRGPGRPPKSEPVIAQ